MDDLISRRAAIDAINDLPNCPNGYSDTYDKASIISALEDVPSTQPEQTDCEYCHEDSDGYVKPIEKNCHAFIRFGMNGRELSLKANGWHGSAKIRYCPMCGRDLYVK